MQSQAAATQAFETSREILFVPNACSGSALHLAGTPTRIQKEREQTVHQAPPASRSQTGCRSPVVEKTSDREVSAPRKLFH